MLPARPGNCEAERAVAPIGGALPRFAAVCGLQADETSVRVYRRHDGPAGYSVERADKAIGAGIAGGRNRTQAAPVKGAESLADGLVGVIELDAVVCDRVVNEMGSGSLPRCRGDH